jgi:hypothetical protein
MPRRALAPFLLLVPGVAAPQPKGPEALAPLFEAWRAFQRPKLVAGVPDYRPAAMAAQHRGLKAFQAKLAALDTRSWPIPAQVDAELLRAEMAGLDFDHRVLRPWAEDPAFYCTVQGEQSDQPAPEGPLAFGLVHLWKATFPVTDRQAAELRPGLQAIPGLLAQAKANLVGKRGDLWTHARLSLTDQTEALKAFAGKLEGTRPELRAEVVRALDATVAFTAWVARQAPTKKAAAGIGVANYDWYLKHVQLLPHTWKEEVALLTRELARAKALLALEEHRNRALPDLKPVASAEEHARAFADAVPRYLDFLRAQDVMTLPEDFGPALQARLGTFRPGPRAFFTEVDYREPRAMRTHGYHWFDLAWMEHRPHPDPIRRGPLLYNIFDTRTEGHATGWEEQMLQLGLFDDQRRSRELIYILLAQRAARGLATLRMHAGEFTLDQAARFAAAQTPRGWLRLEDGLVWGEQHLYLRQPGYGTSYITGKLELEKLLARRREQLGAAFSLREFMDAFNAAGLIPASLLRWEMTGELPEDVARMLQRP